jgi:hypothetical protein
LSRTTPTSLSIPKLVDCTVCNGKGQYKGMFYQMVCDACDGNGELDIETGESVSKETMVFVLKKRLKQKEEQIAYLESLTQSTSKNKGHWDEFKSVNGGKQRFD